MKTRTQHAIAGASHSWSREDQSAGTADWLRPLVDFGLIGVICVAPYFFGGRHDLGRLVFVLLVAVTATAWFVRQALQPTSRWKDTVAYAVLLLAVALLTLQIVPLPAAWIEWLSPRNAELFPLWHAEEGGSAALGNWSTISLTPHETTKALALLVAYCLLFVVVVQRIESVADVRRLLRWIGIAAAAMACFGLFQYFTSNGSFFWFYEYPFRNTDLYACGSFINRNHFANFLVMGVGPLLAWLLESWNESSTQLVKRRHHSPHSLPTVPILVAIAVVVTAFAVFLSLSRGGTLALAVAIVVIGAVYAHARLIDAKYLWSFVGLAVAVLALLSLYGYDQVSKRMNTVTQGSLEKVDHNEGRRKIWKANMAAFQNGGLLGAGAGSHRMIYPVYLPESQQREYTHAENGYLQVATETGVLGVLLLITGIGVCGAWCLTCLSHARSDLARLCAGATCAGLAASAAHSLVDFVWYIPACMGVVIVLVGCTLRLAQLAKMEEQAEIGARPSTGARPSRLSWTTGAVVVSAAATWMVWTYIGPAMASLSWDRYRLISADNSKFARQTLNDLLANVPVSPAAELEQESMLHAMLRHLERVVAWDPDFARARLRLATYLVSEFERRQQSSANPMDVSQIRDAALASNFKSPADLKAWLDRAFGEDSALLYYALSHAHAAARQCPLQGEAYIVLADLCFLEGASRTQVDAYLNQALRVRPHDGDVLFEVGKQKLLTGDVNAALTCWKECYRDSGPHQLQIIHLLAGRIAAAMFLQEFQPDWRSLYVLWKRYRLLGQQPEDLQTITDYAVRITARETQRSSDPETANIWLMQATMYTDLGQDAAAVECLERANALNPRLYGVRLPLGRELVKVGRLAEAEAHLRWCLSRHPENKSISNLLVEVSKMRMAQQEEHSPFQPATK